MMLIQFDDTSGRRIGNAVRFVEDQANRRKPLSYAPALEARRPKVFRVCTFTGSWPIGSSKVVTFKNQTSTPNTVSATNLFWPLPNGPLRDCAIARDGTSWYLVTPQVYLANAATAAALTTTELRFNTLPAVALADTGTVTFSVAITTCATSPA